MCLLLHSSFTDVPKDITAGYEDREVITECELALTTVLIIFLSDQQILPTKLLLLLDIWTYSLMK